MQSNADNCLISSLLGFVIFVQIAGMKAAFPEDEWHLVMLLVNQLDQACQDVSDEEAKCVLFRATALLITANSMLFLVSYEFTVFFHKQIKNSVYPLCIGQPIG